MTPRRSILAAVDLPLDFADLAPVLDIATDARWTVHLLYCADAEPAFVGYSDTDSGGELQHQLNQRKVSRDQLELVAAKLLELEIDSEVHVVPGPIVETILACASKVDAQLIAVLGHKHNVAHRLVLGSVVSSLLKAADRPVLVVPPATAVAIDDTPAVAAVDRLLEIIARPDIDHDPELAQAASEFRDAAGSGIDASKTETNRLLDALHRFETSHVSLTRAINDVAYYLSGLGL